MNHCKNIYIVNSILDNPFFISVKTFLSTTKWQIAINYNFVDTSILFDLVPKVLHDDI